VTPDAKKQVVRDVIAAIDAQDLDTLRTHPGLYETVQHMPHLWATITGLRHTVDHITVEGDMVATVLTVTGTHTGSFIGETPTGEEISFTVLGMDRVEDGKITLHYAIPDLFPFVMMGIGSPEPALA
jgi:predicted ester cyclase